MSDGMSSDDDDDDHEKGNDAREKMNDDAGQGNECDLEVLETQERPEDFCIDVDPIDDCSIAEGHDREVSFGWTGFKIVGDNIDKNIRPSFQRVNHQTVSLHYFHSCAVSDRINLLSLSDIAPSLVLLLYYQT